MRSAKSWLLRRLALRQFPAAKYFSRFFDVLNFAGARSFDPERQKLLSQADKSAGGIAVDLYFDLPSDVGLIDSMSSH